MEPINVSVNVKVDFSESTKAFITGLFSGRSVTSAPAAPAAHKPEAPKPAASVAPKPEAPKPAATATSANPKSDITIDEVRKALSLKVNAHRAEIKDKLNELGAPSVTKLDASKYQEMFDFLNTLD